jgi:hypothetical protein
MLVHHLS